MSEMVWMLLLLSVITVCVVILTVVGIAMAHDLRFTLKQLRRVLARSRRIASETQSALGHLRAAVAVITGLVRHVDRAVRRTCDSATGAVDEFVELKEKAQQMVNRWIGNGHHGAGSASRRHVRRRG